MDRTDRKDVTEPKITKVRITKPNRTVKTNRPKVKPKPIDRTAKVATVTFVSVGTDRKAMKACKSHDRDIRLGRDSSNGAIGGAKLSTVTFLSVETVLLSPFFFTCMLILRSLA